MRRKKFVGTRIMAVLMTAMMIFSMLPETALMVNASEKAEELYDETEVNSDFIEDDIESERESDKITIESALGDEENKTTEEQNSDSENIDSIDEEEVPSDDSDNNEESDDLDEAIIDESEEDSIEEEEDTEDLETLDTDLAYNSAYNDSTDDAGFVWKDNSSILFRYDGDAEEVKIPTYATEIWANAFKDNTTMKVLDMRGCKITKIGQNAFANCSALEKVYLPKALVTIDESVILNVRRGPFYNDKALVEVTFEGGTTTIAPKVFENCETGLKKINLPSTTKTIGEFAFRQCTTLEEIIFPASLTKIEKDAFNGCSGLTNVVIPDNVDTIGNYAFASCTSMTSLKLPAKLQNIGQAAFAYNPGITSIVIPKSVTKVDEFVVDNVRRGPFFRATALEEATFEEGMTTIPAKIFENSETDLKKINFPSTIKTIGEFAFRQCTTLKEIDFPISLTKIEKDAFNGCNGLTNVVIPDNVDTIGDYALASCTSMTTLKLPGKLQNIGGAAFAYNPGLTSIVIPKSVKNVSEIVDLNVRRGPFYKDSALEEVIFEEGMTIIPARILENCDTSVKNIVMPSTTTVIGAYAFAGCNDYELPSTLVLPAKLTKIDKAAFYDNTSYSAIQFPNTLTTIGDSAFEKCKYLEEITLPIKLTTIGNYAFKDCQFMTKINFDKAVSKIGSYVFEGDDLLTIYAIKGTTSAATLKAANYPYEHYLGPEYSINYVLDGGVNNELNPTTYHYSTTSIPLKNPTKLGYTFSGWYTSSSFKTKVTGISAKSVGRKTFYAKWTINKYSVIFDKNGATSGITKTMTCKYGNTYNLRANQYKRKGYTFLGWATDKYGDVVYEDGAEITSLSAKKGAKITLYAKWKKNTYTIQYELDGGVNNEGNPDTYTVTTAISLKKPAKPGYTFKGWYKNAKKTISVTKISKGTVGNKTFYAKWAANKYWVAFNANGGTGSMGEQKGTYATGKTITLNEDLITKDGCEFIGWNTKADGSGVVIDDGADLAALAKSTSYKKIVLYAMWNE